VEFVVLTENETNESSFCINDRELVDLVVPDDVVCFLERCALGCGNELIDGSHESAYLGVK
jgi:hypothetical protein